jgi:hypothetical protein
MTRHLRHVLVAAGVVLACAIYWSVSRDDAAAGRQGAHRLAAATGARATTQPATRAQPQFSARRALQGLYGNYDPVLDGAYWTISGAPKALAEWNGRQVVIKPLISKSDDTATRHVLVTNSVDVKNGIVVKQGTGCRKCKSLLGGALFVRQGDEWKLVAEHRLLAAEGTFGSPPSVAVAFRDTDNVEIRFDRASDDPAAIREAVSIVLSSSGRVVTSDTPRPRTRRAERRHTDEALPSPTAAHAAPAASAAAVSD